MKQEIIHKQLKMNRKNRFLLTLVTVILLLSGSAKAQCPTIDYPRRSTTPWMVERGWDTAVTCLNDRITIICSTFTTAQTFMCYKVDSIEYNPPDTTFMSTAGGGARMNLTIDDNFQSVGLQTLPFDFVFFGETYRSALVGPNGTIKFGTDTELAALTSGSSGTFCDYHASNHPLTNNQNQVVGYSADAYMAKSIWSMHCDLWPTYSYAPHGFYRAVYDTFPCRKLVVNYNHVAKYGYSTGNKYSTVQTVCYEGTNIIEVHIQHHDPEENASSHCQTVAINYGNITDPTYYNGIPHGGVRDDVLYPACQGAYPIPLGTGGTRCNQVLAYEAWRWTPMGPTLRNITWYHGTTISDDTRILGNEGDSILFDPNVDSIVNVKPTVPMTLTFRMQYVGAGNYIYDLHNTITIGVNKDNTIAWSDQNDTVLCLQEGTRISMEPARTALAQPQSTHWTCDDPDISTYLHLSTNHGNNVSIDGSVGGILLEPDELDHPVTFTVDVLFTNGCSNHDSVTVHFINSINDTIFPHICDGDEYLFHGQSYNYPATESFDTLNEWGCPKRQILRLFVESAFDTLYNIKDCLPYTWINGQTYETTSTDRLELHTQFGCDSIIRLNFERDQGLEALIGAVPAAATLDNLHLQFKDMSLGSDARLWLFPNGTSDTVVTVYYEFPTDEDSIVIYLVAMRNYPEFGSTCYDTTSITIPLLKEAIWFPNAFTPNRDVNYEWRVVGTGIVTLEVDIFDRQGQLVSHFEGIENGWDGTDLNGNELPAGNYVFYATYTNVLDPRNPLHKTGNILLLR